MWVNGKYLGRNRPCKAVLDLFNVQAIPLPKLLVFYVEAVGGTGDGGPLGMAKVFPL